MQNTGKTSEGQFVASYEKAGAFVHRFEDAAGLYGRNGRAVMTPEQPADFLVAHRGEMFLAEVKSTRVLVRFPSSTLRPKQHAAGIKATRAGCLYYVFLHRLETDTWCRIPYGLIEDRSSLGPTELEACAWTFPDA